MSLKDQLRDWLGGLWEDFWNVPYRNALAAGAITLLLIVRAFWRTEAALFPSVRSSYHIASPLILLLVLVLLGVALPRRIR